MKLNLLAGAALVGVFAASGAYAAQADTGWYGAIDAGGHEMQAMSLHAGGDPTLVARANTDTDWTGFARIGYKVAPHVRVELEGGYRPGNLRSVTGTDSSGFSALCAVNPPAGTCPRPAGSVENFSLMGNLLFDILPDGAVDPFIGGGAGIAHVRVQANGRVLGLAPPQNVTVDDSDTKFAWQGIAGLAFRVSDQLNVDLTYRYIATQDINFTSVGSGVGPASFQPGVINGKYSDQSVTIGLRYLF
ncbi:MAG: outer membrane protein, partial [Caulobacterales bacterium]